MSHGSRLGFNPKLTPVLAAVLTACLIVGVSLASAAAPSVTIEVASTIGYTTAHAEGTVDPHGLETECRFDYVSDAQFNAEEGGGFESPASAFCDPFPVEGSGPQAVKAELTGLSPATSYHLRLVAANADGQSEAIASGTFTTLAATAPTATIDPVTGITASSAHLSGFVNPTAPEAAPVADPDVEAAFRTSWYFSCEPVACDGVLSGEVEADNTDNQVQADAEDLEPNTDYTVTIHAANAAGENTGPVQTSFKTDAIVPSAFAGINAPDGKGAIVTGYVNPHNSPITDCHFEYGLTESYGQSAQCDKDPGSSGRSVIVSADLSGLDPAATYHFKLVAASAVGPAESLDATFTSPATFAPAPTCANPAALGVARLPDCRAWEMVSPPDKRGGALNLGAGSIRASSTGGAVLFDSNVTFADAKGTGIVGVTTYRADRHMPSWSTRAILPRQDVNPNAGSNGAVFDWFSPDLSHGLLRAGDPVLAPDAPPHVPNLYLTDGQGGSPQTISTSVNPVGVAGPFYSPASVDTADNYNMVAFESMLRLTADPSSCFFCPKPYIWDRGVLELASILPDGTPAPNSHFGPGAISVAEDVGAFGNDLAARAFSDDGTRWYFSAPSVGDTRLYLRKRDTATTVWASESEASSPAPSPQHAQLVGVATDGSRAVFITSEALLDADQNTGEDLYMYQDSPDPAAESNLTLLSADHEDADGVEAEVRGVLGTSDDSHRVYFAAGRQIVAGAPSDASATKLYVWEDGAVKFIAMLSNSSDEISNWEKAAHERTSRLTPGGRFLVFTTATPQPGAFDSAGHREVYRYDALTNQLTCVSCGVIAAPATADASILFSGAIGLTRGYPNHATRPLSADGSRVFFNTAEPLVPADSNGKEDAYQWEAAGAGSCELPQGCVALLSSGKGGGPSYFLDASADGEDAFIATVDRLSRWDHEDGADLDIYDARVGGGLPEPTVSPPGCQGDACQPPPVLLNDPTPASAGTFGSGNSKVPKRHKPKKHHPKKHHKRGHRRAANDNRRASR